MDNVGKDAEPDRAVTRVGRDIGGVIHENAPTPDQLKNRLSQLLKDRACLLIVDDAWQRTHAETFQVGGAQCRLLLTTRDAEIPRALGATLRPVDVLEEHQAVALLEQWAEGSLADTPLDLKQRIAAQLEYLPLALKLAGAQLQRAAPARWLEDFDVHRLKLRRTETVHDSLEQTFALSLAELSPDARRGYVALAIFKEDEAVPCVAIARLWAALLGWDAEETSEELDDLAARALLERSRCHTGTPSDADSPIILHDLMHDFIAAELGEPGQYAAHGALLGTYRATQTGQGWHTAPDDGYLYAHLAYHLDAAGESAALRALFADDAWLRARTVADGYLCDGYLADLAMAWARARAADLATAHAQAAADCVHYALIQTSLNALASNYNPALVAQAVKTSLWSPERGASVARRIVDKEKRITMVIALLDTQSLPETLQADMQRVGLAAVRAQWSEEGQVKALAALAPHLTGNLLAEGLAVARAIKAERWRTRALAALAPHLMGGLLTERLAAARAIKDEWDRAQALAALAPHLTDDLLAEGLAAARAIEDERWRAQTLAALAPRLTGGLLMSGLAAVRAIEDERWWAQTLAALAPRLTGTTQEIVLAEGMATARAIRDDKARWHALAALAPHLTDKAREAVLMEELLALAPTTKCLEPVIVVEETALAEALAILALHFTDGLLAVGVS